MTQPENSNLATLPELIEQKCGPVERVERIVDELGIDEDHLLDGLKHHMFDSRVQTFTLGNRRFVKVETN